MNFILAILLSILSCAVAAAPFLTSDPVSSSPLPTHCGLYLDTSAKLEAAVTKDSSGTYCKFDIASVSVGAHTAKATHIVRDSIWGTLESGYSNTVNFTKPGAPAAPGGFGLSP